MTDFPPIEGEVREHFAAKVTDLPPTEIVCRCGKVFNGDDPIQEIKTHMSEEEQS